MYTTDQIRQQRKLRELNASTIRALSANPKVHLRQQQFFKGNVPLNFGPHVSLQDIEQAEHIRGVADSLSLRLLHSNPTVHQKQRPTFAVARLLYDWLETLRCEALTPDTLPGTKHNLINRFYHWSSGYHHSGNTQTTLGILLYTVAQMSWSRLHARPVYPETEDLIEVTRAKLSASLGHDLAALRRFRGEQSLYATHALNIANSIQASVDLVEKSTKNTDQSKNNQKNLNQFALLLDSDELGEEGVISSNNSNIQDIVATPISYQVFSREFDTLTYVADNIRPILLEQYREQINLRRQTQHLPFHLLVQRLRRVLLTPSGIDWELNQEEGLLDGRRLSQLVSSPMERRLFKKIQAQWLSDCSISFLIDCSGSMKHHAETLTMMVDLLSDALEKCGTKTEILGFSTNAWNGGRPYRQWQARGRKAYSGRLNEVDHRVFKDSDTSWKRANRSITALLKLDLYREGIDGEAVQWASQRLLQQNTRRKVLYIISDGFPMDSATSLANDESYLSQHLQQVIFQYQRQGIEIWGIGIGLDLSHLYPNSLIADLEKGLDNHFIDDFIHSLAKRTYSS